ncbi:MFS transporter [Amycolatopsis sp. PS_44_ISF1]|uniref:MFS transporter n=1 Tax=Amycolatopsis sp. PS_44_ISF1 TaxID=2974917 RepID=UPI0028DFB02B|nr:MFS transporter [Amycolatopsis sp. PS_44_ISF1]MDT8911893.1 MFS transporter [Amycolatopsis sp. PS_44_ISF1]
MIVGSILNPVNSSIIAVSLVPIGVALGAPPAQTAWLVSALYLATAIGQPVVGRLVDLYGPRRLFLIGGALVGVAGVLGLVAPNLPVLIVARVLLGFGTCAGYPAAMSLIRGESERTGRDRPAGVLTLLSITTQTVAVIGPTLGGLLIGLGGWRATIAVNLPLSAACLVLGGLYLPRGHQRPDGPVRLDLPGIGLFAATLVSLLLFLMNPNAAHWYLPVIALGAGAGFAVRELRTTDPFLDLRVLGGNLPLLLTYVRSLLAYVVSYAFLYGYTQWLEEGRGLSASRAGLLLLPVFLVGIGVAALTGRYRELRGKLLVGAAGQIAACALLFTLGGAGSVWLLVLVAVVLGLPQGLNSLALQNSVYHQADPERIGASSGLLRTFMYLGAMVASAATGGFFGPRADTAGLHSLAWFVLAVSGLFLAVTLFDRTLRPAAAK